MAQKALEKAKQTLENRPYQNEEYYHTTFLLEQAFFDLKGTELRQQQTNLQAIFSNLTIYHHCYASECLYGYFSSKFISNRLQHSLTRCDSTRSTICRVSR